MVKTQEMKVQSSGEKIEAGKAEPMRPGPVYTPPVDILEDVAGITVLADLPGVKPADLSVDLREGMLTIRGHCEALGSETEQEILREFEPGTYFRQFAISDAVERSGIEAKLTNGVLRLWLPKVEAAKPRRIQVKSA